MSAIGIHTIENAINYWRNIEGTNGIFLGKNARSLADIYGAMIYENKTCVTENELSEAQKKALSTAFQSHKKNEN